MNRFFIIILNFWYFLSLEGNLPHSIERISANPANVLNFLKPFLPENPVILECGGCNGEETVRFSAYWPESVIYTFEPIPELFQQLTYRTENFQNIHRYQLALADRTGKLSFFFSDYNNTGNPSGSSSLLPPKEVFKFDHALTFNKIIDVDAMTLDDWALQEGVEHIDFMWLDMQGFELNMLKVSELAKTVHIIYIEVEFIEVYAGQYLYPEIKHWMEQNGFELIALDFDENLGLLGDKLVQPGNGLPYYGNAIFLNLNSKANR